MKQENKNTATGKTEIIDVPDPTPPTQAELDAREKANLADAIIQRAVVELVKILVANNTIKMTDFSAALRTMIQRYNQL